MEGDENQKNPGMSVLKEEREQTNRMKEFLNSCVLIDS